MAEFAPTRSQQAAIDARDSAVLVSAGAGSGKTRVLTERLMAYLTGPEPVDIDRFLVITFTRAAAGELRGRIAQAVAAALAADPSNRRLRRQSALLRRAEIGTIHSFCQRLLRQHSHALGIAPDFRVMDDDRAAAMKAAALENVLERFYAAAEEHPGFLLLADTVGAGRDDRRLGELVLALHEKMQSHARPELWAKQQVERLRERHSDVGETQWGQELLKSAEETVAYWADEMDGLLAAMAREEKIRAAYETSVAGTADALRELQRRLRIGWDSARECLPVPFGRLGSVRNSPDVELSEFIKNRRKACKDAMEKLEGDFADDSQKLLDEMALTAPAMEALLELTLAFDRQFTADKRRGGLLDYADLEHLTAQLLTQEDDTPTELALSVQRQYEEIMVDEYQDVSRVQDSIFRAISREGSNLFFVGDVKQSIYRFRLADPTIFTDKYLRYRDHDIAAPGEPRRILLQENFRSRREILDAANSVFSRCMSRRLGDLDYGENEKLVCGASYYEGAGEKPELLLLALPKDGGGEERADKDAREAELVAREIRRLMASNIQVQGRPLDYGDIAILLRSANSVGGVYRRVLINHGIPVQSGQGGDFYTSIEVSTAISLLSIIDNPHQDIPLIAALRSPVFGFTADELSAVRAADKDTDFYGALRAAAKSDNKSAAFLQTLDQLRRQSADTSVEDLVWTLLGELDMLALCSAMPDGEQRRTNLLALTELAQRFEQSGYRGLHRFVLWLRRQSERGEEPARGAQSASAVQISSIHRSKGLEYPVVFLCNTARRFNKTDSRQTVLVHPELGLGPKFTDLRRRVEYPTLARNAIRQRLEREMLSEEMRLLYVAMTRPKERLIITAALPDPEARIEKLRLSIAGKLGAVQLGAASAPVDWLLLSILSGGDAISYRICEPDEGETAEERAPVRTEPDAETLHRLEENLSFVYPHRAAENLPSKLTATELKGRREADEDAQALSIDKPSFTFRRPDFARADKPLTGAERGTATHLVLQYMDFAAAGSLDAIKKEIERLRCIQVISEREAEAVDAAAIHTLFRSPLGQRMLRAEQREREFKFSLLVDAASLGGAEGEEQLLQGVVDCCIIEDGALTVIDYKTDGVRTSEQIAARSAYYAGQLHAYAMALTRIFALPVKECVLYYLAAGEAVRVPM